MQLGGTELTRINLYNYRYEELLAKKIRSYGLFSLAIIFALLINLFGYSYFYWKITYQETRNSFLKIELDSLNNKLQPVREFNSRLNDLNQKLQLINNAELRRDDLVAFFQELDKDIPGKVYLTSLKVQESNVQLAGVSASPLYIADFLQKLRDVDGAFYAPVLISNSRIDGNFYTFAINVSLKPDLVAETENNDKP